MDRIAELVPSQQLAGMMPILNAGVEEIGRETAYPEEDLIIGLRTILSAGIRPKDAIDVLWATMSLTSRLGEEVAEAADALTTVINIWGLDVKHAEDISERLADRVIRSTSTLRGLAKRLREIGFKAAIEGRSFEETIRS